MKQLEKFLEGLIYNSRWLLAPFYLGLVLSIVLLLIKFIKEFTHVVPVVLWEGGSQVIVGITGRYRSGGEPPVDHRLCWV